MVEPRLNLVSGCELCSNNYPAQSWGLSVIWFFSCCCMTAAIMPVTKGLHEECVYGCSYMYFFMLLLLLNTRVLFLKSHAITNMFGKSTAFIIWRLICFTDNWAWREGGRKWWFVNLYLRLTHWNITIISRQLICQRQHGSVESFMGWHSN